MISAAGAFDSVEGQVDGEPERDLAAAPAGFLIPGATAAASIGEFWIRVGVLPEVVPEQAVTMPAKSPA
ncbi:hypothetical protein [Actinoplanes sp. NPDC026623]|uniref:hypothetical protein n=1 Tax=Actinoplanes sp. NPDC026623 TaxID=3155610 RepID=UPI0033CAAF73